MKNELNKLSKFDYSQLDIDTKEYLEEKEHNLRNIAAKAATDVGRELYQAQQKLAGNNQYNGMFQKWYESLGFKKNKVYNLIDRYRLVVGNSNNQNLENLPDSLLYEAGKENAPQELVQKVLDGDITSHKEYIELKNKFEDKKKQYDNLCLQFSDSMDNGLQDKLDEKEQVIEQLQKEITELETKSQTDTQDPKLLQQIKEKEEEIEDLQEEIRLLNEQEPEVKYEDRPKTLQKLATTKKTQDELKQDLLRKEARISEYENIIEQYKNNLSARDNQIKSLKEELAEANKVLEDKEEIQRIKDKINELKKKQSKVFDEMENIQKVYSFVDDAKDFIDKKMIQIGTLYLPTNNSSPAWRNELLNVVEIIENFTFAIRQKLENSEK